MPFISDEDTLKLAKQYLSGDQCAHMAYHLEMMRHLDDCLATGTPSDRCPRDPSENLLWCSVGVKIHEAEFEDLMQLLLYKHEHGGEDPPDYEPRSYPRSYPQWTQQ
jgi:hypothetical protein